MKQRSPESDISPRFSNFLFIHLIEDKKLHFYQCMYIFLRAYQLTTNQTAAKHPSGAGRGNFYHLQKFLNDSAGVLRTQRKVSEVSRPMKDSVEISETTTNLMQNQLLQVQTLRESFQIQIHHLNKH